MRHCRFGPDSAGGELCTSGGASISFQPPSTSLLCRRSLDCLAAAVSRKHLQIYTSKHLQMQARASRRAVSAARDGRASAGVGAARITILFITSQACGGVRAAARGHEPCRARAERRGRLCLLSPCMTVKARPRRPVLPRARRRGGSRRQVPPGGPGGGPRTERHVRGLIFCVIHRPDRGRRAGRCGSDGAGQSRPVGQQVGARWPVDARWRVVCCRPAPFQILPSVLSSRCRIFRNKIVQIAVFDTCGCYSFPYFTRNERFNPTARCHHTVLKNCRIRDVGWQSAALLDTCPVCARVSTCRRARIVSGGTFDGGPVGSVAGRGCLGVRR